MEMEQGKPPKEAVTDAGKPYITAQEITKEDWVGWIKWFLSYADKEETIFIYHCICAYMTRPGRNARFTENRKA